MLSRKYYLHYKFLICRKHTNNIASKSVSMANKDVVSNK